MKRIIVAISLMFSMHMNAQDTSETYISISPCITNEIGSLATKVSPTIEIGKQYNGIFTMGLALGKTNCESPKILNDLYLEFRPNLNVFQIGKFTNTITPGFGWVFGPDPAIMIEWTSGIEYALTDKLHFNVFFGSYYYSGFDVNITQRYSPSFFGFSVVRFFKSVKNKGVLNNLK